MDSERPPSLSLSLARAISRTILSSVTCQLVLDVSDIVLEFVVRDILIAYSPTFASIIGKIWRR